MSAGSTKTGTSQLHQQHYKTNDDVKIIYLINDQKYKKKESGSENKLENIFNLVSILFRTNNFLINFFFMYCIVLYFRHTQNINVIHYFCVKLKTELFFYFTD